MIVSSMRDPRLAAAGGGGSSPGQAASVSRLIRFPEMVTSAAPPERDERAYDRADARSRHVVDRVAVLLQHLERADVGVAARAAGAERETQLRAREVAAEPGEVVRRQRPGGGAHQARDRDRP